MKLSPIVLFVYNRPWHTEQTLIALKNNVYAKESKLFIFCDGKKENVTIEEIQNINKVREIVRNDQWCKEVTIIERENNLGLADSIISGVTQIVNKYGKVIVLEDDIVTGKYFLNFMNASLNLYESDKNVFGVSGYKYPTLRYIKDSTFFLPISCSWSYATWKDRWNKVNFIGKELLDIVDNQNLSLEINFSGYNYYQMLKDQVAGKNNSWAIRFYVSMFLNKSYFLFPHISLVENIGFNDKYATHTKGKSHFELVKKSDSFIEMNKIDITIDTKIAHSVQLKNVDYKKNKRVLFFEGLLRIK